MLSGSSGRIIVSAILSAGAREKSLEGVGRAVVQWVDT